MVADIVDLASILNGLQATLNGAQRERRDRLGIYLQEISACLDEALDDLRHGGTAVRACERLHQYAELIPLTVDEVLDVEWTECLSKSLHTAFCVLGLSTSTIDELNRLGEAAGAFAALGSYLR